MPNALTLTFRGVPRSTALDSLARELDERLHRCDNRINRCHFIFECHGRVDASAALFGVKMHVSLPTAQLHADSAVSCGMGHADVLEAVRHAYADIKRQLEGLQRERVSREVPRTRRYPRSRRLAGAE